MLLLFWDILFYVVSLNVRDVISVLCHTTFWRCVSYTSTCRFIKWLFCSYYILLCIVSYNVLAALFMSCTSECCMVLSCFGCSVHFHVICRSECRLGLYPVLAVLLSGVIYFLVSVYTTFWLFCSFHILLRVWLNHILTVSCVEYFCLSWTTKFRLFCLCHIYLSVVSCNVLYVSYTSAYRVIHCSAVLLVSYTSCNLEMNYLISCSRNVACISHWSYLRPVFSARLIIQRTLVKNLLLLLCLFLFLCLHSSFFCWTLIIKTQTM